MVRWHGLRPPLRSFLLFAGGCVFVLAFQQVMSSFSSCSDEYGLLNPNIPCDGQMEQGEWVYEPLRDRLTEMKEQFKDEGRVSHLSLYFRDLSNGPRFGIGEYDKFQPASLSKVPIMIALLHHADLDPTILDKTLSFSGSLRVDPNVERAEETIKPNTPYTVRELIRRMIVYSDNYSFALLVRELNATPPVIAYYTFRDLDLLQMMLAPKADFVSIQDYSRLFAVLHNHGYLSKEMSQFALELLSQSTYRDALVAGVPEGTTVAHKFGLRDLPEGEIQLHDCGIVYHPKRRYILCVMTSGTNQRDLQSVIASISKTIYDDMSDLPND